MATRFYFASSGTPAATPAMNDGGEWQHVNSVRLPMHAGAAGATTLAFTNYSPDAADDLTNKDSLVAQFVSDEQLAAQTISAQTVKRQFQAWETFANDQLFVTIKIFICSADGSTIKETLLAIKRDATEVPVAQANAANRGDSDTISSATVEDGDRLVIEIGLGGNITTGSGGTIGHNGGMRFGEDASSGDLPENDTEAGTTFRPWLEFANTLTFLSAPVDLPAASAAAAAQALSVGPSVLSVPVATGTTSAQSLSIGASVLALPVASVAAAAQALTVAATLVALPVATAGTSAQPLFSTLGLPVASAVVSAQALTVDVGIPPLPIVSMCGFESGHNSFEAGGAVTGTVTVTTTNARINGYALRINPSGTGVISFPIGKVDAQGFLDNLWNLPDVYRTFYVYVVALPASGSEEIYTCMAVGSVPKLAIRITSAGKLQVYDQTLTNQLGSDSAATLSTSTRYRIDVHIGTGTAGNWELKLYNDPGEGVEPTLLDTLSGTGDLTTNNSIRDVIGKRVDHNGQGYDLYFDDCIASDTDYVGPCHIVRLAPNANGSTQDWTSGTGSSDYQEVDEVPNNDTNYVMCAAGAGDKVGLFAFESSAAKGISGVVHAVELFATVREDIATGTPAMKCRIRSGSTNDDGTTSGQSTTVGARGRLLYTDPDTGGEWTPTAIDNVEGGMVETAAKSTRMTAVMLFVAYTPPSTIALPTVSAAATAQTPAVLGIVNLPVASAAASAQELFIPGAGIALPVASVSVAAASSIITEQTLEVAAAAASAQSLTVNLGGTPISLPVATVTATLTELAKALGLPPSSVVVAAQSLSAGGQTQAALPVASVAATVTALAKILGLPPASAAATVTALAKALGLPVASVLAAVQDLTVPGAVIVPAASVAAQAQGFTVAGTTLVALPVASVAAVAQQLARAAGLPVASTLLAAQALAAMLGISVASAAATALELGVLGGQPTFARNLHRMSSFSTVHPAPSFETIH